MIWVAKKEVMLRPMFILAASDDAEFGLVLSVRFIMTGLQQLAGGIRTRLQKVDMDLKWKTKLSSDNWYNYRLLKVQGLWKIVLINFY